MVQFHIPYLGVVQIEINLPTPEEDEPGRWERSTRGAGETWAEGYTEAINCE